MTQYSRLDLTDVACTLCGAVCDDLRLAVESGQVVAADRACRIAEPWFLAQGPTDGLPVATENGQPTDLDAALDAAAALLKASRSPLIYGLSRSSTEAQRAATALAERLGATIDTTASTGHAASIVALQEVGESTCTLGEVRSRADLVVFWGSDPERTHPRHRERYCPPGVKTIVVDVADTATTAIADEFVRVEPGTDWELLWQLRLLAGDHPVETTPQVKRLAGQLLAAWFGVVFFGTGIARGPLGHRTVAALLSLVTDLNRSRRFYARRMRRFGDVTGADSVLTWQTGYPFGVNFAAGFPRYNPGEFTAPEMLARDEIDCTVVVGSETLRGLPPESLAALNRHPVILLDGPHQPTALTPAVRFTTAVYGVHLPGTAYRLDEVPIPLRPVLETTLPSDAAVLAGLLTRLLNEPEA